MDKFNINIGSLSSDENQELNDIANSGQTVNLGRSSANTKHRTVTVHQTVVQHGENCYTMDTAEGLHIGDTY